MKKENIYIIGFPMGFTPELYDIITTALDGGKYNWISTGEFLNIKGIERSINTTHLHLKRTEPIYWQQKNEDLKLKFLNELHDGPEFYVLRDTTDPLVLKKFVEQRGVNAIYAKKDLFAVTYNCIKNKITFPCGENNKNPEPIDLYKKFVDVESRVCGLKSVFYEDLFADTSKIFNILREFGYEPTEYNYLNKAMQKRKRDYDSTLASADFKEFRKTIEDKNV